MPLVTKLGRDVTFPEGVPYISSYDPFDHAVLGDHVTNQKYYIYIYIHYHNAYGYQTWQARNKTWVVPLHNVTRSFITCGLARSREKWDLLYLYNHRAYDHQTWQGGKLLWEASIRKVTITFNYVVLQYHLTNQIRYFSTTTVTAVTKLGRVITCGASSHKVTRSLDHVVL